MNDSLPIVTTTSRSTFRRCPQKWYWKFVMGLTPKGDKADALWFGTGIHIALAEWYKLGYKRGPHPADTFENWYAGDERSIRVASDQEGERAQFEDARDLGSAMLEGYVDEYGKDPDWQVLAIEQPFKVKVMSHGEPIAHFISTWDGVLRWRVDGNIYLAEHKTAAQIMLAYLELDDQGGTYLAVASSWLRAKGILKEGKNISGIMYNFLRKSMPDDRERDEGGRYLNKDGSVSKRQPPPKFVRHTVERSPGEHKSQMQRLANEVVLMNGMRDGSLPIVKNTTRDCTFCEFFDMCVTNEHGGDTWKEIARSLYTRTDPFARYRKSASE